MELLTQLGVNETIWIQLGMFLVVFSVLKIVAFDPYYAAFVERKERTVGKTELAERFVSEARALEEQFSSKAQEANERYREVYDKTRAEAIREYDRQVGEARTKAKGLTDKAATEIKKETEAARVQLAQEVSQVSQLINIKLIGKELKA